MGNDKRIVVGVDGSEPSKTALRWAIRQAKLTGGSVDAVTAWRYPAGFGLARVIGKTDFERGTRKSLAEVLGEVSGPEPGVPVRPLVYEGHAADVLLRVARDASLLVVGSRGYGGFGSALTGSVSLNCMLHAHCPVVVMRGTREAGATARG